MLVVYIVALAISLAGIGFVFALAFTERTTGRTIAPRAKRVLDSYADRLKIVGDKIADGVEDLPSTATHFGLYALHVIAVLVAIISRAAERRAHRVADFVSHKRSFERGETKSSFLKEVREHKDGLTVPEDISEQK